jgi:hypothetical protein
MSTTPNVTDSPKKTRTQPVIGKATSYKAINSLLMSSTELFASAFGGKKKTKEEQFDIEKYVAKKTKGKGVAPLNLVEDILRRSKDTMS